MNTANGETSASTKEKTSNVTKTERLKAAAVKLDGLANQFEDDRDLYWELTKFADKMRGKLIDAATAKVTWIYDDPFDRCAGFLYLVRAPDSESWICMEDLPMQTRDALMKKIHAGEIEDDQPERDKWPFWAREIQAQLASETEEEREARIKALEAQIEEMRADGDDDLLF